MLKSELIRPRLRINRERVWPRSLPANYHYLDMANDLVTIFQRYVGHSRADLVTALRAYEGDSLEYPIIRGLAAVIEQQCQFGNSPPVDPTELRKQLFSRGPITRRLDLFNQIKRPEVIQEAATHYQITPAEVEQALFADLHEEQTLLVADDLPAPGELIARYNLEVARGLLYWAREVDITLSDHYKDVFKYIKLFKLMHTVQPLTLEDKTGYTIRLHGPISPFVNSTIRYGLQFAKFLPALLLCEQWQMMAQVQLPRNENNLSYQLDDKCELRTHFKSSGLYDSQYEADFAAEFAEKYEGPKRKWILDREDTIITVGDSVFIPDFSLAHRQDGRRALIEIVGFWHPHYLQRKLDKVREAGLTNLILIVYDSANVAEGAFETVSAGEVLHFSRKPVLKTVLAAVDRVAT